MAPKAPPNSAKPTTGEVVAGTYNATPIVLEDGQAAPLQLDVNGKLITTGSGGGGTSDVNIAEVGGSPEGLGNPLPVELSDGTQAVGTPGNPLSVNVISGGGSNASVGATGVIAPTSATEIGIIDGSGNLQGASSTNPVPVTGAVAITGPVTATITGTVTTQDAADGTVGSTAPTVAGQSGAVNSLGKLTALQSDANGNLLVGFNGQLLTVFQEILSEMRALRRLMYMVYEESGEGNPTQSLLDDPSNPTQVDYQ